jgi:two-component system chemotaxis response regulator CheB
MNGGGKNLSAIKERKAFANELGPIRIMIVDDSATIRGIWTKVLSSCKDLSVVSLAENGKRALELLPASRPDLILLDIEMPEMDGITALPLLFKARPGVRVIMASSLTQKGSSAAVHALALGASDYIGKPSSTSLGTSISEISQELIIKIRSLKYPTREGDKKPQIVTQKTISEMKALSPPKLIVVGCSTGGPNALITLFQGLNIASMTIPIVIVQHMPTYFIALLAERVEKEIKRACVVITGSESLAPGFIGLAPGDHHVEIAGDVRSARLTINQAPPENFCRPAVDPLFRSAGRVFGPHVVGVVLTGMGEDGKRGSEAIRNGGGTIIAQDEESSTVWGMPGAVAKSNLANYILPLSEIGPSLQKLCGAGVKFDS